MGKPDDKPSLALCLRVKQLLRSIFLPPSLRSIVMQLTDSTFKQGRVELDGNEFIRCHFIETTLVFSAHASFSMTNCLLDNVTWVFDGAALRTLACLTALYHEGGESGKQLIEQTFEKIRKRSIEFTVSGPPQTSIKYI